MKNRIHQKLLKDCEALVEWYSQKIDNSYQPFYASFDIRDAGFKIGNIDGNIFPAGFNNICQVDKDNAPDLAKSFLSKKFPTAKKILILAEDHLKNMYYWENVISISEMLTDAGYEVAPGMLSDEIGEEVEMTSFSGKTIKVEKIRSEAGKLMTKSFSPDIVVVNNDFSNAYENIDFSKSIMTPARELGWYQRKKHCYFHYYNKLITEFAEIIDEDPWLFNVETKLFNKFDITDDKSRSDLAEQVEQLIGSTKEKYKEHGITEDPYVFIKNNAGTYGLGVVEASSGEDILKWNYKSKKKMKASKGGGGIQEVIIQEGIPSILTQDDATAEPVLYMVGDELVGGFLRTHEKKDSHQSLNSPGAVYKKLCLSDLKVRAEGCVLENVYGWVAKIGLLAITEEARALKL